MADPTPAEKAKLDKGARRWLKRTAAASALTWVLFAAAIWLTDWRLAGLGVLVSMLAVGCLIVYALLCSPKWRQIAVDNAREQKAASVAAEEDSRG